MEDLFLVFLFVQIYNHKYIYDLQEIYVDNNNNFDIYIYLKSHNIKQIFFYDINDNYMKQLVYAVF